MDGKDQGVSGGDPGDGWGDEIESEGLRGWISPDDRLWRHPSEAGAAVVGPPTTAWGREGPPARVRSSTWIIGGATACMVVVLAAAGLVAAGTAGQGSSSTTPGTASLTGVPTTVAGLGRIPVPSTIAAMVSSIRPSTVALRINGTNGVSTTTGLVAEAGGIIVTPSQAVAGAKSITAIEPGGPHQVADVVGIDPPSGLAVLSIADDLPAATFDTNDPAIGDVAVAAALRPGAAADSAPSSLVYAGTVVSTGQALGADSVTTAFSATAVEAPLSHDDLGCPLLDGTGQVSGMLEMTKGTGTSTMAVFLPAELVLGVARQIVASGTVDHGWMGIATSNADPVTTAPDGAVVTATSAPGGARLDSIDHGSPAADAGLAPGDIIIAIDGHRVHSAAELRSRLYPEPPGSTLAVSFERGGTTLITSVVLADQGTAAPGDASSS